MFRAAVKVTPWSALTYQLPTRLLSANPFETSSRPSSRGTTWPPIVCGGVIGPTRTNGPPAVER